MKRLNLIVPTVMLCVATVSQQVSAAQTLIEKTISVAFQPVISLLKGISFPLALLMFCYGFIIVMLGNKTKGLQIIKTAIIGYLGIQLIPALMEIIRQVGDAMEVATKIQ